jgi:hypothetical protein
MIARRLDPAPAMMLRRAFLALTVSLAVLAAPARAQAPAQGVPTRLTDQEFWKFIVDVSEPNGYFRSDNFVSNELGFQYVIPELQRTGKPGGIYLGVGPDQNFTYIAELKPKMAVIFDIRRGNMHMHMMYKALFEMSSDRADFISRLFSKPRPVRLDSTTTVDSLWWAYWHVATDSVLYRRNLAAIKDHLVKTHGFALTQEDLAGIDYVYTGFYIEGPVINYNYGSQDIGRGGNYPGFAELTWQTDQRGVKRSFMATEANFRVLKDMHTRNVIIPVVGNFAGPTAIRRVGAYLRERGATVTTIYTSNVEQYLFQQGDEWSRYYENVATLPLDSTSMFIRSVGTGNTSRFPSPGGRLPSVLSSVQGLIAAYRAGQINSYIDVINFSH